MQKKAIVGISSVELTVDEIDLFTKYQPYGIILFKRNCKDPVQLQALNRSIKALIPNCMIFIDQEGGRVARLKEPEFKEFPAASSLKSREKVYNNYKEMGEYLYSLGIDANCAPVADLYFDFANNIIGDRSFGEDVEQVIKFASAAAEGLLDSGIVPVIKHIPGHGRALADSHLELPIVDSSIEELEKTDFKVFKALQHLPMAMTAHIIYTALDPDQPVSISKKSIDYIRSTLGFKGLIMSDAIEMKALKGDFSSLAKQVLDAGCDIVLHCTGEIEEMKQVLSSC